MRNIYYVRCLDEVRCHSIHIKFNKDWFWHSKVNEGGFRGAQTYRRTDAQPHSIDIALSLFEGSEIRIFIVTNLG